MVDLYNPFQLLACLSILTDLSADNLCHRNSFAPHHRIQLFDMAKLEDGHDVLSLKAMLIAFHNDQPISKHKAEEVSQFPRLLEVVRSLDKDFADRFGIRQEEAILVAETSEVDQAIIWDVGDPFEKIDCRRLLEQCQAIAQ
jgi:hypothetical protein